MPESIENRLQRIHGQIETSVELSIASNESITLTTNIVVVSKELIARSRAQIARTKHHEQLSGMLNR